MQPLVGAQASCEGAIASKRLSENEGLTREFVMVWLVFVALLPTMTSINTPPDLRPSPSQFPCLVDRRDNNNMSLYDIPAGVCHMWVLHASCPARRSSSRSLPH